MADLDLDRSQATLDEPVDLSTERVVLEVKIKCAAVGGYLRIGPPEDPVKR